MGVKFVKISSQVYRSMVSGIWVRIKQKKLVKSEFWINSRENFKNILKKFVGTLKQFQKKTLRKLGKLDKFGVEIAEISSQLYRSLVLDKLG